MKKIFPPNTIKTLYRPEKNLKGILSPSLFPSKTKQIENSITSCNKCDICKNFLVSDTKFKCKVTGKYIISEVNLLVIPLMLFILSPVPTVMINM